jgi:hypothetical protein
METLFNWKTRFFSRNYYIYKYEGLVGELVKINFSRKTRGEIFGKEIMFETRGFFKQETQITDLRDSSVLGTITYLSWKRRSLINYQGNEYKWQYDNFFRSRWSVSDANGAVIRYSSKFLKGTISSYTNDGILVLAGFFIRNHFREKSAHTAAAS